MIIRIKKLTFDAIVGILPHEREMAQGVCVNAKITYDFTKTKFIDYAHVCQLIEEDMKKKRYLLLEEALKGVYETILDAYPFLQSMRLKIFKPTILPNAIVGLCHTFFNHKN